MQVEADLGMVDKQLEVLKTFPIHPKRTTYEQELTEEQEKLTKLKENFSSKVKEFTYVLVYLFNHCLCIPILIISCFVHYLLFIYFLSYFLFPVICIFPVPYFLFPIICIFPISYCLSPILSTFVYLSNKPIIIIIN